ncbi:hypothetical protein [Sphingomonas bacterium]|uniref:hypothetical protein n=1 Tax=Sphingomonas bacterium TaxID=1895847 RepID=UPI0015775169|nr:hypothetical protein [Sphingomonas bacterium]
MTYRLFPLLALAVAVPGVAKDAAPDRSGGAREAPAADAPWAQLSIHERIVIRIPRMRREPPPPPAEPPPVPWREKRGARCIPADGIVGALVSSPGSVDIVMDDGQRTRALLEADCPALDYYLGFYIKPTTDGNVCAGRDAIRSRSGAICPIRAFRQLVPRR